MSGAIRVVPSAATILIGSILKETPERVSAETVREMVRYLNLSWQYSENIVATVFTTISTFVLSVAVTSMKMFLVFSVIFECSELMIGGNERTWSTLS